MTPSDLLDTLRWRYATKTFDPAKPIPAAILAALEDSLVLTPSSYGLQPWKFLIITDKAIREQLVPHAWGQRQVADCSHLVLFTVKSTFTIEDIDAHVTNLAATRSMPATALQPLRDMMVNDIIHGPRGKNYLEWAKRQAYIALGQLMLAAAALGVDTCPMEGFVPEEFTRILDLDKLGLSPVVACPLGYRASDDKYAGFAKVRFPKDEVIVRI